MPTYIYPSEKIYPYVYIGFHKITGQFYIGYHANKATQKLPSHLDLGTNYFTSSKIIKELGFYNFDWTILAEFFDGKDAYDFEQNLIGEYWGHPLLLNGHYSKIGKYSMVGRKHSDKTKKQLSEKVKEES